MEHSARSLILFGMALLSLLASHAEAAGDSRERRHQIDVGAVVRLFSHYVPERMPRTPPHAFLVEPKIRYVFQDTLSVYGIVGLPAAATSSHEYGAGLGLKVSDFRDPRRWIRALKAHLLFETVYYSTQAPSPGYTYEGAGAQVRYGGALSFGIGGRTMFETALLATRFSDNWCIAPSVGLMVRL